jgi:hypothetical protein
VVLLVLDETPGRQWTRSELAAELSGHGVDWVGDLAALSATLTTLRKQHRVVRDESGKWSLKSQEDVAAASQQGIQGPTDES